MSSAATLPWKLRPVFLSSTFLDMQAERDHLRRHVFPRLEEALRARRHHLDWIDLRQGIEPGEGVAPSTAEQRELLVLKVCLAEVKRSRPFLIVLLGDRYGWVPPPARIESAAREAGFTGDIAGRSVTALEIEYGILKESANQPHRCFFYLREPLPYEAMPPALRGAFCERFDSKPDAPAKWAALEALKQRLATDPELTPRVRHYRAKWDPTKGAQGEVSGLEAWGNAVFDDIWQELDAETRAFAASPAPTWEDTERTALAEFIEHRTRDFTGREDTVASLLALATSSVAEGAAWGACVTGPPGSGKSALFAQLAKQLTATAGTLLLANSAGGTLRGASIDSMLRRWVGELAAFLGVKDPLAENASPDDVDQAFASFLGRAALKTRVVVLVDALDQFESTSRAQHLTWRPKLWPPNARLLATALPGPQAVVLSQWAGVEEIALPPLDVTHARAIARKVWSRYHVPWAELVWQSLAEKTLPDGSAAVGNPLWTTLACEQLALLDADDFARASHEFRAAGTDTQARLAVLRHALAVDLPSDVSALYGRLLSLAEKIHGAAPGRAFATAIALSRHGWREVDLAGLVPRLACRLFPDTPPVNITPLELAGLRRSFRAHLVPRGAESQWDFAHAQMRLAVERHAIAGEPERRALHAAITDYLETLPASDGMIRHERMRHLIGERDALRAGRYYAKLEVSRSSSLVNHVGSSWTLLEWIASGEPRRGGSDGRKTQNAHLEWVVSWLGAPGLAAPEIGRLVSNFLYGLQKKMGPIVGLSPKLQLGSACTAALTGLAAANPKNTHLQHDLFISHGLVGDALLAQGDLVGASQAYCAGLTITERMATQDPGNLGWQHDLSAGHIKVGDVLFAQGNRTGAKDAYRAAFTVAEKLAATDPGNVTLQHDFSVSHDRIGDVLQTQGDLGGAIQAFRATQMILTRLAAADRSNTGWQRDLSVSHTKVGDVLFAQGDLAGAFEASRATHEIMTELASADPGNAGWQRDLAVSHTKVGDVLFAQGDLAGACEAFRAGLSIKERIASADPCNAYLQQNLSVSYVKVGEVLLAQGDLDGAVRAFRGAREILARLAMADPTDATTRNDLAITHNKFCNVFFAQGDLAGAVQACRAGLAINEQLATTDPSNTVWQRGLGVSYAKLAELAARQGDASASQSNWRHCHLVLRKMSDALQYLDASAQKILAQLETAESGDYRAMFDAVQARVSHRPPPASVKSHAELLASAEHSFSRGHWEAAETGFEKLLAQGEPLLALAPKQVSCLLNAHEVVPPASVTRITAICAELEAAGASALAADLRQKLAAKQAAAGSPPKKPWWKPW